MSVTLRVKPMLKIKAAAAPSANQPNRNEIRISVFNNAMVTLGRAQRVEQIIELIQTGGRKLKGQIEQIRNSMEMELTLTDDFQEAKKAVADLKKQLPAVTWSGTFSHRANNSLEKHSGLLCGDLDDLNSELPVVRRKLVKSPHVLLLFTSPSGVGLKIIFRVAAVAEKHAESFRAVEQHVRELTGRQIDQSGKDLARLCFLSHDPEVYHNPNAVEIEPLSEPEKPKRVLKQSSVCNDNPDKAQIREMLAVLPKRPDYADWIKVVAAVGDVLPDDEAIEVLKEWSPEEQEGEYADKLRHRLKDVHIGTLIHMAREHGWEPKIDSDAQRPDLRKGSEVDPNKSPEGDEEAIARLAALPVLEYERSREAEAKKLGSRESVLDRLVEAKRPRNHENNGLQGNVVKLRDVEPWPVPVNGAEVLDDISKTFESYLVLPDGAADAIALWIAHTHCFEVFLCSPRLNITSPERECAKTLTRDVVAEFVPRPIKAENLTTAVLFRLVDRQAPVVLADEYDRWVERNEELVGLLNAGHRQGGMVLRCEGDNNEVRGFRAYGPAFLSGIGALTGTLHDRSIVVRMTRAKLEEIKARKRFDPRHTETEQELCRKLVRWIADNRDKIAACDPKLPEGVFNRRADNWRPLFAIAEVAGSDSSERCKVAFAKLTGRANEDTESVRVMLLCDIRDVFAAADDVIFSHDLTEKLNGLKDRPWPEANRGKPISERWLALKIGAFGIKSKNVRIGDKQAKGYERADLEDAFSRFLPESCNTSVQASRTEGKSDFHNRPKDEPGTLMKTACTEGMGRLDACTGGVPENESLVEPVGQAETLIGDESGVARL